MQLPVKDGWAKHGNRDDPPPPSKITAEVWAEAKAKLKPHADTAPTPVDAKT